MSINPQFIVSYSFSSVHKPIKVPWRVASSPGSPIFFNARKRKEGESGTQNHVRDVKRCKRENINVTWAAQQSESRSTFRLSILLEIWTYNDYLQVCVCLYSRCSPLRTNPISQIHWAYRTALFHTRGEGGTRLVGGYITTIPIMHFSLSLYKQS